MGWDFLTDLGNDITHWLSQHFLNILIILVGTWLLRIFLIRLLQGIVGATVRKDMFPNEHTRHKRIQTLDSLVSAVVRVGTWVLAIIMIISEMGVNMGPLLASAGFVAVVLGIGAQSLIKDFVSGIFIITEDQYRIGDTIKVGSVQGEVEAITIRTTVLRDIDGNVHHVPNGTISVSTNMTNGFNRLHEEFVVPVDTDLHQLEHIINHVGTQLTHKHELAGKILDPPRFVRITGFDNAGYRVKVMGTTAEGENDVVQGAFYSHLLDALSKYNIRVLSDQQITVHNAKPTKK